MLPFISSPYNNITIVIIVTGTRASERTGRNTAAGHWTTTTTVQHRRVVIQFAFPRRFFFHTHAVAVIVVINYYLLMIITRSSRPRVLVMRRLRSVLNGGRTSARADRYCDDDQDARNLAGNAAYFGARDGIAAVAPCETRRETSRPRCPSRSPPAHCRDDGDKHKKKINYMFESREKRLRNIDYRFELSNFPLGTRSISIDFKTIWTPKRRKRCNVDRLRCLYI